MEILGLHAGVVAEVRPVAVVVHHDVGDDLDVEAVRGVDHVAQGAARAVARGERAALGHVAEVETVVEVVADVGPLGALAGGPLGRRGNPEEVVADFRRLRQAPVHLVPVGLEPLEHDLGFRKHREKEEGDEEDRVAAIH